MATTVYSARPIGPGRWKVSGVVEREPRVVTFEFEDEPTMEQCEAALRGETVERVLQEPAPVPVPGGKPADPNTPPPPPADPDVADLLEGNVSAVAERVAVVADRELLERARAAEDAGLGRKTAVAAIDARLDELTAAGK